jgi:hypothetical protein
MLGLYVQRLCALDQVPLFDSVDKFGRCEKFCVGPRIQFTHRPLVWQNQFATDLRFGNVVSPFLDKRIVLIVRHPLDTLVSLWFQRKHRGDCSYQENLLEFLKDEIWGLPKYFRFYLLWHEHNERVREFLLLRYEDLRRNPFATFSSLVNFLRLPVHEGEIHRAVSDADFRRMRKMEETGTAPSYPSSGLNIFGVTKAKDSGSFHVRRGKIDGYRDYLAHSDIDRLFDRINSDLPDFYGYYAPSNEINTGDLTR